MKCDNMCNVLDTYKYSQIAAIIDAITSTYFPRDSSFYLTVELKPPDNCALLIFESSALGTVPDGGA